MLPSFSSLTIEAPSMSGFREKARFSRGEATRRQITKVVRRKSDPPRVATPNVNSDCLRDFVLENPGHSFLWQMPFTKQLLAQARVKEILTAYCRYGFEYKKPTRFFTSLMNVTLKPPCSTTDVCEPRMSSRDGLHPKKLSGVPRSESNRIPPGIVEVFIRQWADKHKGTGIEGYIFVDLFAGTGSVCDTVNSILQRDPTLFDGKQVVVIDNRYKDAEGTLDANMCSLTLMRSVRVGYELYRILLENKEKPKLNINNCAVLFWLSTECRTYSVQAAWKHRCLKLPSGKCSNTATTTDATTDDMMNDKMFSELVRDVLCPDIPLPNNDTATNPMAM